MADWEDPDEERQERDEERQLFIAENRKDLFMASICRLTEALFKGGFGTINECRLEATEQVSFIRKDIYD